MKELSKEAKSTKLPGKKYVKYSEGAALYSMGKAAFMEMAKEAGAVYRYGRSVWVNLEIFEEYFQRFRDC